MFFLPCLSFLLIAQKWRRQCDSDVYLVIFLRSTHSLFLDLWRNDGNSYIASQLWGRNIWGSMKSLMYLDWDCRKKSPPSPAQSVSGGCGQHETAVALGLLQEHRAAALHHLETSHKKRLCQLPRLLTWAYFWGSGCWCFLTNPAPSWWIFLGKGRVHILKVECQSS